MRALFTAAGAIFCTVPPRPSASNRSSSVRHGLRYAVTGSGSETAHGYRDFDGKLLDPIQFMATDHQNRPNVAAAIATKWFDMEGVTTLMDAACPSPALAVMNIADKRHKIVLLSSPGALAITNTNCTPTMVLWPPTPMATRRLSGVPSSGRAARAGSSSSPTTRSVIRWKTTQPRS